MVSTVYIDMDDTLADFSTAFRRDLERNPAVRYPQSQYGFFTRLAPIEGAIDAVQALAASEHYDPYILTAPSTRNPLSYTEKRVWVEDCLGYPFVSRLIICAHKNLLKGDYLIDDYHQGKGQESFEGRLIHFASPQYPDWAAVRKELGV